MLLQKIKIFYINLIIIYNSKLITIDTINIIKSMSNDYVLNETNYKNKQNNLVNMNSQHQHHFKHEKDELIINTGSGKVRGTSFYLDDELNEVNKEDNSENLSRINAWLGIPFAEKPIGDLRFKRPIPIKSWKETLNATKLPNSCFQIDDTVISNFKGVEIWNSNTELSEDCLYLNIWTPHPLPKNSPVMVWIYGGGFATGTSTLEIYDPKILVAETQLIYVSIQYRLNVFGFLYMDHENAPGNQGLLDQYLALTWIHNNIQYFGGDSTQITLFGESAGSVSVSFHLLSPLSSKLFNNAIMESGTALGEWTLLKSDDAIVRYTKILNHMGCNGTKYEMIECVRQIDTKTVLDQADEYFYTHANHGVLQYTFLPVVDNYFLEEEPISLLNRGKFKRCPILMGANKDEGNWLFVYAFPEYRNFSARPEFDYETLKDFLMSLYHFYPQFPYTSSQSVMSAIQYRYTHWENVDNSHKNFESFDEAASDFHFVCPLIDFASIYALNDQDVFFYYFTQRSSRHYWPEWMGVMHGDEISFVFGEPLNPSKNFTQNEKVLTRKILKYWSNFVRYNNPNGHDENTNPVFIEKNTLDITTETLEQIIEPWPKFKVVKNPTNDEQKAYLILNSEKISTGFNLRAEYCAFWNSFIPNLVLNEYKCFRSVENSLVIGKSSAKNLLSENIFIFLIISCYMIYSF